MRSIASAVSLLAGLLLVTSAAADPLASQYRANQQLDACQAADRLADFLVERQRPGAGGVGWAWRIGQDELAPNMAGLVSLALLDAYAATGSLRHLRAAQRHADGQLLRPRAGLPYKPDIEVMVRLYGVFEDPAYRRAARQQFERIRARSPRGADEVARIAAGRQGQPALLGYDAAQAIRAALAVGERRYAFGLADAVLERRGDWFRPERDARFALVSTAALISALESLDAAHYRARLAPLRDWLAAAQADSGAWHHNETQPTAHAVLALLFAPRPAHREAARRGLEWLRSTLLRAGGLAAFNDHMPEPFVGEVLSGVNAEALMALSAACRLQRGTE